MKRSLNPPNFHSTPTNSISYKNWHIQLKFDNLFRLMRLKLRSWEVNEVARVTLIKKFNQKSCNLQFLNLRIDFTLKKKEKIFTRFSSIKKNWIANFYHFLFPGFSRVGTASTTYISMTSLLAHTVALPTKCRFLPKNLSQLVIFVIELAFTWSWVNKNHQNLIFKVNFLCQFYSFDFSFCLSYCISRTTYNKTILW